MASMSKGCPVCSGETKAIGDHKIYNVICLKGCYRELYDFGFYTFYVFGKFVAAFNEEDYDACYEKIEKEILYWKTNHRYVAKWLEEPVSKAWTVRETIGAAIINTSAYKANIK